MLNKKIIKFGKSFKDVENIKKNFIIENNKFLKNLDKIRNLYKKQSKRLNCKACNCKLKGKKFKNHEIIYVECKSCSHINGIFQDTDNFNHKVYSSKKFHYHSRYYEKNFKRFLYRRKKIYIPKAEFLKKNFKSTSKIDIIDVGSGTGYFLSALKKVGFKNVQGYEVSKDMVKYGKKILAIEKFDNCLEHKNSEEIRKILKVTNCNCITMIGVLEHLQDLENFMKIVKKNKNIKYIYLCVPVFSFSVIFENVFPNVMNRHLGGGHTHLFTEKSLKKLMQRFNFLIQSSWWFGSDIYDLYRSLKVSIGQNQPGLSNKLDEFRNIIDEFQYIIDKNKLSSQVHALFRRV